MSLEETIEAIVRRVIREEMAARERVAWEGCVSIRDAAAKVGVSVSTIEKWGRAGLRISKRGHVRRVDVAELRAFMERQPVDSRAASADEIAERVLSGATRRHH